jgi:hypothetical protein
MQTQSSVKLKYRSLTNTLFVKNMENRKMQNSTSKKSMALITTILLMTSIMLTIIPSVSGRSTTDPTSGIDWNGFSTHYDPATMGVWPQFDTSSPNIPVAALIYPGLPPGAVPKYSHFTHAFLSARPRTVGIGQPVLVNTWISPGLYHAFFCPDFLITIEDPTGHQDVRTADSYYADATYWFEFTPTMVGTYRLKFNFQGLFIPAAMYEDSPLGTGFFGLANNTFNVKTSNYYEPSETPWTEVEVQDDLVWSWPAAALPEDYWDRPINPMNREWWSIAGNYPWNGIEYRMDGSTLWSGGDYRYTAYAEGPDSAHIVWKRPQAIAGLVGGEYYQYSETSGGGAPNIIFSGRCYQSRDKVIDGEVVGVWECYDLRTGELYWDRTDVSGTPNRILYEVGASEPVPGAEASAGVNMYLVGISGGTLRKYDPWDGDLSLERELPDGFGSNDMYNNEWVMSVQNQGGGNYRLINWSMRGNTNDFEDRIYSNISWPISGLGSVRDYKEGLVVDSFMGWNVPPGPQWGIGMHFWIYDMFTGEELWHYATNDSEYETTQTGGSTWICKEGMLVSASQGRHWVAYDLRAKKLAWISDETAYPWGNWHPYNRASYDLDTNGDGDGDTPCVISGTYEGVYAINILNGTIMWHYVPSRSVQFENPYVTENGGAASPFFTGVITGDHKVFAYNGEHTASQPYGRDWSVYCLNADTGEEIWTVYNPMRPAAFADGYLVTQNTYDGYLYVFGQGKTEMTVSAPETAVPLGESMVIGGSVLDMSPAQPGTPCVSEDVMNIQMEYLHLQQPIDSIWHNVTIEGVEVSLTAMDVNDPMNYVDLGTVTTNGYTGEFGMEWTPTEEGFYEIYASFGPTEAYGSSSASTFVSVGPAPQETQTPEPSPPPEPEHPIISLEAALIIAVVVIAAVVILAWALMRRK